jgi:TPR repeat protein
MNRLKLIARAGAFSFCTSLALLSLSSQVHAITDLEQGLQAQSDGNLKAAATHFQVAAQTGSSEAQYQLGMLYVQGIGVEENLENAKTLVQQAASQGHVLATEWLSAHVVSVTPSVEEEEEEEDPEDDC